MESNDNELKQDFLRKEIMDQNYDISEFLSFLYNKFGENATDLELYSMNQLSDIVKEFKSQNNPKEGEPEDELERRDSSNEENYTPKDTNQISESKPNQDEINSFKKLKVEKYEDVIQGAKIELSKISFQDFTTSICSPEKKDGGLFSKSYISYLIKTAPFNFEVRRRYSDFEWLRTILSEQFPALVIPPIPLKNFSDRFNDEFVDKRMRYLQRFLNSLDTNPTLANCSIYGDFLSIVNESDWNNKKKHYAKLTKPINLNEMKTIDGSVLCSLSSAEETELDTVKFYETLNENNLNKLTISFKALNNEMIAVSTRMNEISDIFEQLYFISKKSHDNKQVTDSYKLMKKVMKEWGRTFIQQKDLLDVELREYLNYSKRELMCFKDNITKVEAFKYNYYKNEKRVLDKKEELFKLGQVNKYEIPNDVLNKLDLKLLTKNKEYAFDNMLPKEQELIVQLKRTYAFYNTNLLSEFRRIRNLNGEKHRKQFIRLSEKHTDILTDLHVMWADLLSYYSEIYDSASHKEKNKTLIQNDIEKENIGGDYENTK